MPTTRSQAASTPALRSFSRRVTSSGGTVNPGMVKLRAMPALATTMTPA
jgi:hypothetical protein